MVAGHYHHPDELFSFKAPAMMPGAKIEEMLSPRIDVITFRDDYGHLIRVEVVTSTKEKYEGLTALLREDEEKTVRELFVYCVFDLIAQAFPDTKILEEKFCEVEGIGNVFFVVINIPGGSTLQNADTGEVFDSMRAYTLFVKENQFIAISIQDGLPGSDFTEANNQFLFNKLLEIRSSYEGPLCSESL
jgi:hypothetical protein